MAINRPAQYLICYDIADPKRLAKVHRFVASEAVPLQYSVFLAYVTPRELDEIISGLNALINPTRDDIRIYRLPEKPRAVAMGKSILPPEVQLITPEGLRLAPAPDIDPAADQA